MKTKFLKFPFKAPTKFVIGAFRVPINLAKTSSLEGSNAKTKTS